MLLCSMMLKQYFCLRHQSHLAPHHPNISALRLCFPILPSPHIIFYQVQPRALLDQIPRIGPHCQIAAIMPAPGRACHTRSKSQIWTRGYKSQIHRSTAMYSGQVPHETWQYASPESQAKAGLKLYVIRPQPQGLC